MEATNTFWEMLNEAFDTYQYELDKADRDLGSAIRIRDAAVNAAGEKYAAAYRELTGDIRKMESAATSGKTGN